MENLLSYNDLAPTIGMLELNVLNLSKAVRERDARIVALEAENKTMREQLSQRNGKMKEKVVG